MSEATSSVSAVRKQVEPGFVAGYLTVVRFAHSRDGKKWWQCLCRCGNVTHAMTGHLKSRDTLSCGCMTPAKLDLIGQRFGRLVVVALATTKDHKRYWECRCDCGNVSTVVTSSLRQGQTTSCGCVGAAWHITHGKTGTAEYHVWEQMCLRCTNPKHASWKNWGGRGIRVCDEWLNDFAAFLAHVGERPSEGHSIDRFPDNDGHYEPGNVRWATAKEQARNKRNNVVLEFRGRRLCLAEWAEVAGINASTLSMRIRRRWTAERALTVPPSFLRQAPSPSCPSAP